MSDHVDLPAIIQRVRRRWRLKLALRGATTVLAVGVVLLVAAAFGLRLSRFNPAFIVGFRVALGVAFVAVAGWFVARPLMRRVSDHQVALYLEEHEPALDAAMISAVEARDLLGPGAASHERDSRSPALIARLVESAIEKCAATNAPTRAERRKLTRYTAAVTAVVLLGLGIFGAGPSYLRQALSALLLLSRDLEAAVPYRIDVTPGNATVPKGSDQDVRANLQGFEAKEATLLVRRSPATPFERLPLVRDDKGRFEGMVFDLAGPVDYQVEAGGVISPVFTFKVVDLPYVQQLELEYRFPAYTGLEPQTIENGGDIAVLTGTQVRLKVTPTIKTPGGRVAINEKQSVPLQVGVDGTLTAAFTADRDGFYRIELDAPTGERVAASPQYTIDVLTDQEPRVSFAKPGRDTTASAIEEVFVEAAASDDYGVRGLELVYSVNGGPEQTLKLFDGAKRMSEVSAGHTFYLEEMGVQAGDALSYYARASDNNAVNGAKKATSDLYFVRVRPFKKDFRAAQSMAGGGGGGGGAGSVDALSEQQRQIIAATFNVQRDRKAYSPEKLREHTVVVGLSQSRLREQVEGLVTRMTSRFLEPDPAFKKINELLPKAIAEMKAAETKLTAISPDGALPSEHRALQFLQKAEEEYETQVQSGRQGGGGGGGGSSVSQELAAMFEMDLDKLSNQYETADSATQQSGDQQLDDLLAKLKELARRQEQEAEQQRRRALAGQANSGGAGAQQRALADQTEEAARQLERLSREQNRPDLMDSARRLQDVADAMRKAAASGNQGAASQAAAALERLKETERRLRRTQADRAQHDIQDAQREADSLAREQRDIAEGVRGLQQQSGDARREAARGLDTRKEGLESKIGQLERQLDSSAGQASREEKEAARRLADAANEIRDSRLRDKVRYSRQMLGRASRETSDAVERDISDSIDGLRKKLDQAASAVGRTKPETKDEALQRAQRLARGMESLEQRTRERLDRNAQRQGQQGQQGQGQGQDGQGQQGGGGSQAGARGGGDYGGPGGAWGPRDGLGYGGWDGRRVLDPEDVRQFRGEVRQWTQDAQDLRRRLLADNIDPKDLDDVLRRLRQLDDDRAYKDVSELANMQAFVTEAMKRFEYGLRRQTEEKNKEVVLSGADQVPDTFRSFVEQYYRSLSKK